MIYLVLDLEWNGAYSKKTHGYFNEIIEIGAVKLSESREITGQLDLFIRPVVSRKLTKLVTDLTGITQEQVKDGISFPAALSRLRRFIGKDEVTIMTWSNTDLLVLMENCRYFLGNDRLPFSFSYIDLQAYAQQRLSLGSQQIALEKFAQLLNLDQKQVEFHHAIDDSFVTARIFQSVYEASSFTQTARTADEDFYRRLAYHPTYIKDLNDPLIHRSDLLFSCEICGRNLRRTGKWKSFHHSFSAPFQCQHCSVEYIGRVQARRQYDGVEIKKRLLVKPEPVEDNTAPSDPAIV